MSTPHAYDDNKASVTVRERLISAIDRAAGEDTGTEERAV
jgi:hypothetical protein